MKSVVLSNEMSDVSGRKERINAEVRETHSSQRKIEIESRDSTHEDGEWGTQPRAKSSLWVS